MLERLERPTARGGACGVDHAAPGVVADDRVEVHIGPGDRDPTGPVGLLEGREHLDVAGYEEVAQQCASLVAAGDVAKPVTQPAA